MLILLLRNNSRHILNFRLKNGDFRVCCDKIIPAQEIMNTLSFDNTFSGICPTCKLYVDQSHQADLNEDPRIACNVYYVHYRYLLDYHRDEMLGPFPSFNYAFRRNWAKLKKLQASLGIKVKKND